MTSDPQEPLNDRLKEQVTVSIQEALHKATSVLSGLHRVHSYLDIIFSESLPPSRTNEIVKNAVDQANTARNDAASLLQTVYLTEIGLQSIQDSGKHRTTSSVSSFTSILGDSLNNSSIIPSAPITGSLEKAADTVLGLEGGDLNFSTSGNDVEPSTKKL